MFHHFGIYGCISPTLAPRMTFSNFKVVLAGEGVTEEDQAHHRSDATLAVRALSRSRLSQLRAAILLGLTREIFGFQDRVCCIGGIPDSGQLDTVLVVDVDEEFESVIGQGDEMLPNDVAAESLERLTAIATDLATAGREGKSIGAMFILGDHAEVIKRSKQLILNPFHGYAEEDRNILNPFMDETIKELALIDGAFIVQGNGVVESAGCLIQAKADEIDLPGGMGTRHAAAAAITQTTDSLALVVSSSGQVTYFRRGRCLLYLINQKVDPCDSGMPYKQTSSKARLGFFGGSFDPIHEGHLSVALATIRKFELQKVLLCPAYFAPLRTKKPFFSSKDRLAMVEAVSQMHSPLELFDDEILSEKTCYTYDTLHEVNKKFPNYEVYLMIGDDQYDKFEKMEISSEYP